MMWLLLAAFVALCCGTKVSIYDASPTPVQLVKDSVGNLMFNVHLYILVDTGDPTQIVQGGAFWKWEEHDPWLPAPAVLYDEHQVDPAVRNSTTRGYNIAWGQPLDKVAPHRMFFRVWALSGGDLMPAEAFASKPVVAVAMPPYSSPGRSLDVSLFKAVAFSAGPDDGIHVHLVINVWPAQSPNPPDYQLFAEIADEGGNWVTADAPSRFEHTFDSRPETPGKVYSRYNLSWRLSPAAAKGIECSELPNKTPPPLSFRIRALSFEGASGTLEIPNVDVICVSHTKPLLATPILT